jgi:hypothetical protein
MSDKLIQKIAAQLDKVAEDISEMKVIQAKQEVSLSDHIRRTELLEEGQEKVFSELKPIQRHVDQVSGALKFVGLLSLVIGIIAGIIAII